MARESLKEKKHSVKEVRPSIRESKHSHSKQSKISVKPRISFFLDKKKDSLKLPCQILSPNDSNDPSYTNLALPYRVICRQRYERAGRIFRQQFLREIKKQEMSQSKALSGVRIHREFIYPVLIPMDPKEIIRLTPKQQFKLDHLLKD